MENLEQNQPTQPQSAAGEPTPPLTSQPFPQPLTPEVKPKKSFLLPVLLSLGTLVLGGSLVFAYFVFLKPEKVVPQPTISPSPIPSPTPSPSPSPDLTADWESYMNEEYGFEIRYPNSWTVNKKSYAFKEGGDLFSIHIWGETQKTATELYDGASLTVGSVVESDKDIKTWVREYYGCDQSSEEIIKEIVFQKAMCKGELLYYPIYYNTQKGNYIYSIVTFSAGPNGEQYREVLHQILSTFRFLD